MRKQLMKLIVLIMLALFVVGMRFILTATSYGLQKGNDAVINNGGSLETNKYYLVIETNIENSRTMGMVMGLTGGFGFIVAASQLYRDSKEGE